MGGNTNLPCWLMVWISFHPAWLFIELSIDLCFRDKWPCDSPTQLTASIRARSTRENRLWRCLLYLHSPLWCCVRSSLRTQTTAPISSTFALNQCFAKPAFLLHLQCHFNKLDLVSSFTVTITYSTVMVLLPKHFSYQNYAFARWNAKESVCLIFWTFPINKQIILSGFGNVFH